ncbi:MAG: alkaline phosphatase [Gemmatimonadota bacterium]
MMLVLAVLGLANHEVSAQTTIRIMPPERAVFAVGQRFDIRVEAMAHEPGGAPPAGLRVELDGVEITHANVLDPGVGGERGAGGTGSTDARLSPVRRAGEAPGHTTNFLVRDRSLDAPGEYVLRAWTADGAQASVTLAAHAWELPQPGAQRVRNIIVLLGDGMGLAQRTAARVLARGVAEGKAVGRLAMDVMEATGLVMTFSLNSIITDSAPGMAALSTGQKANNNQLGVFPDNTMGDALDNPRVEYIGAFLRRMRGPGFHVGLVSTADVADATPAANAVHTSNRDDYPPLVAQYLEEGERNGVRVLLGGGSRHFLPGSVEGSSRPDERNLLAEYQAAGFHHLTTDTELQTLLNGPQVPGALLGLFHPRHMSVAFDKVGAGRYSDEFTRDQYEGLRDQPMLDDMTRLALRTLAANSPDGFYLMVEAASIDKEAHAVDPERTVWDTIEFDNAVRVALEFAHRTNTDGDPHNQTLVIVAADHETGGMALVGVGNERYAPQTLGRAVRDYAAVFRFAPEQVLNFFPNYVRDEEGFPLHPDPSRKLLLGWASAPDRFENWISNRFQLPPAVVVRRPGVPEDAPFRGNVTAVANPARSGTELDSDNRTVEGQPIPGFLVPGDTEHGGIPCPADDGCPADTGASPFTIAGHTGSDVPLSASGPGAILFTGTYDNTEVFLRILDAVGGNYGEGLLPPEGAALDLRKLMGR